MLTAAAAAAAAAADEAQLVLQHTVKLSDIKDATFYDCICLPGGQVLAYYFDALSLDQYIPLKYLPLIDYIRV